MRVLQLGCGRTRLAPALESGEPIEAIALDADCTVNPDVVCCLGKDRLPFPDDTFDIAVAIHVLEHIGTQGETAGWFQFWEDLYRVLKPDGRLEFVAPWWQSVWGWGDPSHTRLLSPEALYFFQQANYRIPGSPISPFRIQCDFVPSDYKMMRETEDGPIVSFAGILVAKKPLTPWWEDV